MGRWDKVKVGWSIHMLREKWERSNTSSDNVTPMSSFS